MSKKVTRLYPQFAPDNYKLSLTISEDKLSFTGSVQIIGKKRGRPSARITLHQKGLKISTAGVKHKDKTGKLTEIELTRTVLQNKQDELRLHSGKLLYPGEYTIYLEFSGIISKNMDGIYPCFFEEEGVQKRLIATQFESHHAREAFPCIDEPEAKATFQLTLTGAEHETAISNTPVLKETIAGNLKTTQFEPTPIMSTYLLAFAVGEIEYLEAKSKQGVAIRTYATKNQIKHSAFALEVAVKCLDFFNDYFDIPYPLEKCDLIALPDFASGAMENWGLITFREQTLLYDEANTSLSTKQYVVLVVAHELAHQWFGNLVTMHWWTDLWLNEGFASWIEYLAADKLFPEWNLWTQFAVDEQQLALKSDALEHTHPVEVEVKHPDEIRTIFDAISYQKGASVINMLFHYLGEDDFREGLRSYLKKYSYRNASTVDLWRSLEEDSKKPVRDFMGVWTLHSGHPIIKVEQKNDHLTISQSRFVANPISSAREDKSLWPIPLLTEGLASQIATQKVSNIPVKNNEIPIKLNLGQTGFYRVDYSHSLQQNQLKALDARMLPDIDRMGLLSDSFETTKAGYQPITEYLDLLAHYKDESSLSVWEIITSSIGAIRSSLSTNDDDDTLRDLIKPFVRNLVQGQYKRLGWDKKTSEDHFDTLLRPLIIGLATGSDDKNAVETALGLYKEKLHGESHIDPDLRGIVYSTAARLGGLKEYNELLNIYKSTDSSDEKLAITAALTSFEQSDLHDKVLELIKSDTIRLQDAGYWIAYCFMNRHGRAKTWEWMKENWEWLKKNMGTDLSFSRMPIYAARNFADQKLINNYVEFFSSIMEPLLERSFNQGLEIAQTNTAWRERDSKLALEWFSNNV